MLVTKEQLAEIIKLHKGLMNQNIIKLIDGSLMQETILLERRFNKTEINLLDSIMSGNKIEEDRFVIGKYYNYL